MTTTKPAQGETQREAAARLGVSQTRIGQWVREGRVRKLADGSLDPASVDEAAAIAGARRPKYGAKAATPEAPIAANEALPLMPEDWATIDYAEATRRKEAALAWTRTLEARRTAGELLARADVDAAVMGAFARVRSRLLALPHAVAPRVVGKDAHAAAQEIETAVHEALRELSETQVAELIG